MELDGIALPGETVAPGVEDVLGHAAEYRVCIPSTYLVPPAGEPVLIIGISALGGGTVGKSYADQKWAWDLWADSELVASGRDLGSGAVGATHEQMARTLCNFLSYDGECLAYDPAAEEGKAYGERAREVLESEHERLGLYGIDD